MKPNDELFNRDQIQQTAGRLHEQFRGTFGPETIEKLLADSVARLSDGATVTTYLPLLAERFTRERLHAATKAGRSPKKSKPTVLFLCLHNAGRFQMAAGWLQHLASDRIDVLSADSTQSEQIHPVAVQAMAEVGIDIANHYPKPWTNETLGTADVVVTMGCGDACPVIPGKRYLDFELNDPAGKSLDEVRPIRDEIEARVLIDEIGTPPTDDR